MYKKFLSIMLMCTIVLAMIPAPPALAAHPPAPLSHAPIDSGLEAAIDAAVNSWISEDYNTVKAQPSGTPAGVPGAVVLVTKDGKIIHEKAYGYAYLTDAPDDLAALLSQGARAVNIARNKGSSTAAINGKKLTNPVPMTTDTLFDLASVTKVMATTQAIMKLISDGDIDSVNDTVAKYIPAFAQNGKENVTLAQLLTHSSGISQWEPDYLRLDENGNLFDDDNRDSVLDFYCSLPLTLTPGKYAYSDIGFRMLAYVVETVSKQRLDVYLEDKIYEPLGLTRTTFNPLKNGFTGDDCAATSWGNLYEMAMVDERNLPGFSYNTAAYEEGLIKRDATPGAWRNYTLRGEVNDGNTAMGSAGVSGAAGLFSTASDLAVLGQMMLNGGTYNGVRIYNESVIDDFTSVHQDSTYGYGFKMGEMSFMGNSDNRSVYTFGHDGFTGTQVYFAKETNMVFVVLTNKMNIGTGITYHEATGQYRPQYSRTYYDISPAIADAVYSYYGGKDNLLLTNLVEFNTNGGSSADVQNVKYGKTAVRPPNPTKNDCAFVGWYSDAALTKVYDFATPVTGDIVLYAKWTEESPYVPPTTKTETRKNEDGSTTKTVTDNKTGTVTETTTWPDGTKLITTTDKGGTSISEVTVPKGKNSATMTIPMTRKPGPGEVAVIVRPDGTREIVKTSVATEIGLRITLTEGAKLEIMENSKSFTDVSASGWAAEAVQFVTSRDLFSGTGVNTFSPAAPMSRAMLVTVLARLSGQDTATGEFWYSVGMEWAKENGVSDGTNPDVDITREQLAVMFYRYAKGEKTSGSLSTYSDADQVSGWAAESMAWAVERGIIQGAAGKLNPTDTATRAEVATMLSRYVQSALK